MFVPVTEEDERWRVNWLFAYSHCKSLAEVVRQSALNCTRTDVVDKRIFVRGVPVKTRDHRHQFKSLEAIAKW